MEGLVAHSLTHLTIYPLAVTWTVSTLWSLLLLICFHNLSSQPARGGGNQANSPEQETQGQDNYLKSLAKYELYPGRPEGLH